VRELKNMLSLRDGSDVWTPPVLSTVAARAEGLDGVADAVAEHFAWSERTGALAQRRRLRARSEIEAIGLDQVRTRMEGLRGGEELDTLADRVLAGELDPYAAADELLSRA
jgi:LAO/AO transport system kinase